MATKLNLPRWLQWFCCAALLLSACGLMPTPPATATPTRPPMPTLSPTPPPIKVTPSGGWSLVWADEFDGEQGSAPDPARWSYNVGAGGWGNGENQAYTDRTSNAFIEKGNLVIQANRETYKGSRYTSARLVTKRKGDWIYGRVEVRAKLPFGQGIWPAIWMLPSDGVYGAWPNSGEIDIMELLGHQPQRVFGSLHYGAPHTFNSTSFDLPDGATFADDYHVFAIEWEPDVVRWYVDDNLYFQQSEWFTSSTKGKYPAPFNQRFHLLLNIAVGGAWPGYPDETTSFPQKMFVDYVRVYQHPDMVTLPSAADTPTPEPAGLAQIFASDDAYLRFGPDKAFPRVGEVRSGEALTVFAQSPKGDWLQVKCSNTPSHRAWIFANLTDYNPEWVTLPVIPDQPELPKDLTWTTLPKKTVLHGGPGTAYPWAGSAAEAGTTLEVLGRNAASDWLQVAWETAPGGLAWVYAPLTDYAAQSIQVPVVQQIPPTPAP